MPVFTNVRTIMIKDSAPFRATRSFNLLFFVVVVVVSIIPGVVNVVGVKRIISSLCFGRIVVSAVCSMTNFLGSFFDLEGHPNDRSRTPAWNSKFSRTVSFFGFRAHALRLPGTYGFCNVRYDSIQSTENTK
jgi:hypothetical protein